MTVGAVVDDNPISQPELVHREFFWRVHRSSGSNDSNSLHVSVGRKP